MSRYPYTDAADFIRSRVSEFQVFEGGTMLRIPTISRSEASQAYGAIAEALGMTKQAMAEAIANYAAQAEPDE